MISVRENLQLMKKYILNDLDDNLKKLKEAKKKKKAEEEDDDK